jgi:hypothetical protein
MKHAVAGSCLLVALAVAPTFASAGAFDIFGGPLTWDPFSVDFPGTGQFSSIAVEPGGRPHIAYRDELNGMLKYARKNDNDSWQVFIVDGQFNAGSGVSLALDGANNPHISYYRGPDTVSVGDLKYAKGTCTPSGAAAVCSFAKVVVEAGIHDPFSVGNTSMAIDLNGVPHIAYFDNTHDQLKWARKLSTGWDSANVTGTPGGEVSMVTDSNGFPQMVFSDSGSGQLKFVRIFCAFIFCGWSFETIDAGRTPSFRNSPDGHGHVAYWQSGSIRYALRTCSGDTCTWSPATVGSSGNVRFPGLALDGNAPYVSFIRPSAHFGSEVVYGSKSRFGWSLEIAHDNARPTGNCSMVIDSTKHRHISYPGDSLQSLEYLKGTLPPPPVIFPATFTPAAAATF